MRIIFMGTPLFSVPALEALVHSQHQVVAVYTQPPKPRGRGHQLQETAVHERALALGIPVYTPTSLRSQSVQEEIQSLQADVGVVVAYGLILPSAVLDAPRWGCINIHASLLPRWRGAAPIQRALMAGDTQTGITIMKMDTGLDTGPMISQASVPISDRTTLPELQETLALLGAHLLTEVLTDYPCLVQNQPTIGVTYAAKIAKTESFLDWRLPASLLIRHIKALNPWPGTVLTYKGEDIKILEARTEEDVFFSSPQDVPGTILDDSLLILCGQGALRPLRLQRPGKVPLALEAFLNGTSISKGEVLKVKTFHASL